MVTFFVRKKIEILDERST